METQLEPNSKASRARPVESHFWVSSYPFFEASLFVASDPASQAQQSTQLYLYDCDGAPVNEVEVNFPAGQLGIVELDQFLGQCKLEAGLKHAHLHVVSEAGGKHMLRIHGGSSACMLGPAQEVSQLRSCFFPVLLANERNALVTLVNYGRSDSLVRCRMYVGKRVPEVRINVPALGSRVLSIPAEFSEYAKPDGNKKQPTYLRLSSTCEVPCGAQLIETISPEKEGTIFSAVS
ncbi:MAG: hypothetical protein KDD42_06305 [Bdellovibrionales bacterium]|nr:hypothetical protein [Bdellovibrionales bacterium]